MSYNIRSYIAVAGMVLILALCGAVEAEGATRHHHRRGVHHHRVHARAHKAEADCTPAEVKANECITGPEWEQDERESAQENKESKPVECNGAAIWCGQYELLYTSSEIEENIGTIQEVEDERARIESEESQNI